jgi:hypothetical protein
LPLCVSELSIVLENGLVLFLGGWEVPTVEVDAPEAESEVAAVGVSPQHLFEVELCFIIVLIDGVADRQAIQRSDIS